MFSKISLKLESAHYGEAFTLYSSKDIDFHQLQDT